MLHITGRRDDGYHQLQTVFQLLDYGDELTYSLRDDEQITLTPSIAGVSDAQNLIIRAAKLLRHNVGKSVASTHKTAALQGVDILLDKRLPLGGGIGGGSSNAATTLLALNTLWDCRYSLKQLAELGQQLGADVPVFVQGFSAWAEGIGEQLQAIDIAETWYLVLKPDCQVSTAKIFSHKQLTRDTSPITIAAAFKQGSHNDCETVVRALYPPVDAAFKWLDHRSEKGRHAKLTGTGACVFTSFSDRRSAEQVHRQLPTGLQGFIARGVNQSPTHQQLNQRAIAASIASD